MTDFDSIRDWAHAREIIHGCTGRDQFVKLGEEFGELAESLLRYDLPAIKDAIGDMVVVLTILSAQLDMTIEECIAHAYDQIKDRRGRMVNGTWVKE